MEKFVVISEKEHIDLGTKSSYFFAYLVAADDMEINSNMEKIEEFDNFKEACRFAHEKNIEEKGRLDMLWDYLHEEYEKIKNDYKAVSDALEYLEGAINAAKWGENE